MSAKGLLNENPRPTEDEVKEALSGNFCDASATTRCQGCYGGIREGEVK